MAETRIGAEPKGLSSADKSGIGAMRRSFNTNGWLFVSVALALIAIFTIYPLGNSIWTMLHAGSGAREKFVGLGNIARLFQDPIFLTSLLNTALFFVIQVPLMLLLAIVVASALNSPKMKFKGLFRTLIFLPCVTSLVTYSVLFRGMFGTDGIVNVTLETLHIINGPIPWLSDALWSRVLIIVAITWRWVGYNMIFFLAAMQNIDKSIYEAARIDGVPSTGRFAGLTVPMLKPVILFTAVTSTIGTLQLFDEPMNLTHGGPADATLTMSMYIYNLTFVYIPNYGYAATVSYAILLLVVALAFVQFYVGRDKD